MLSIKIRDRNYSIGFDGRQNIKMINASGCQVTVKEEDLIVFFPRDNYIDHVARSSSKLHDIVKEILPVIRGTNST